MESKDEVDLHIQSIPENNELECDAVFYLHTGDKNKIDDKFNANKITRRHSFGNHLANLEELIMVI